MRDKLDDITLTEIRTLEAKLSEAQKEIEQRKKDYHDVVRELEFVADQLAASEARCERLESALKRYGKHMLICGFCKKSQDTKRGRGDNEEKG